MRIKHIAFAALIVYGCKQLAPAPDAAKPAPTEVITIAQGDISTQNEYTASLQGRADVEVRPQVDGNLVQVFVDEGAYVHAGQPLFKINDQPYRQQCNSAVASLHAAEATIVSAQVDIDKYTPLVQHKVISDVQQKAAMATRQLALANKESALAAVAAAKINLGYTLITAPVSGYVGRLPKKQGSLISRTDPIALTTISDVKDIYAYFSLSESDFIKFKSNYAGNTLNDKIRSLPPVALVLADNSVYEQQGHITMVDGQFDKTTGAITLRATFPNAQGTLRTGNTGKVRLAMQHNDALVVPTAATMEVQDKVYVYLVGDSNKVAKQLITVVGKSGNDYLVEGIRNGDRIVVSGLDHLQDGVRIEPVAPKTSAQLSMKQ